MDNKVKFFVGLLVLFALIALPVSAAVPSVTVYEGQLFNANNKPITSSHIVRLSLWKSADFISSDVNPDGTLNTTATEYGGWYESQTFTPTVNGEFSIEVGKVTPLASEINFDLYKYLQVEIKGFAQPDTAYELLDPTGDNGADTEDRQIIGSVFYARNAQGSDISQVTKSIQAFSTTNDYTTNELVLYNDILYRAKNGITAGSFDINDWEAINWQDIATKLQAESGINLLNVSTGDEITPDTIDNSQLMTPLRTLQSLLANRLTSLFRLYDHTDKTKQLGFDVSNLTTSTTRIITVPDEDIELITKDRTLVTNYDPGKTYLQNQQIFHQGVLYRSKQNINPPEVFDSSKWEAVGGLHPWKIITTAQTLVAAERYGVDTSGGDFSVLLPGSPNSGDEIWVTDADNFFTNNLIINRNGQTISGVAENLVMDIKGGTVRLYFLNNDWKIDFSASENTP